MEIFKNEHKEEYNNIPMYYCKDCLLPTISFVENLEGSEYCEHCNSTNIGQAHVDEWDKLYVQKYGHHYLEEYNNN